MHTCMLPNRVENVQQVLERRQLRDELLHNLAECLEYRVVVDAREMKAVTRREWVHLYKIKKKTPHPQQSENLRLMFDKPACSSSSLTRWWMSRVVSRHGG
jgi:chromatin segregation and condensation protein Rec8/ScpA/Scc1 (kleisin family)